MLPQETLDVLTNHDWPGNVRELANALEHAVILSDGQTISPEDLPSSLSTRRHRKPHGVPVAADSTASIHATTLQEMERGMILATLERNAGDKPKSAAELGIALKTLYNKLNQYQSETAARAS